MTTKVAFLSVFHFSKTQGRYGRMHDIFASLHDRNPDFDYQVVTMIDEEEDLFLSKFGFGIDDLWGSRFHNFEAMLSSHRVVNELFSYDPDILHVTTARPTEAMIARVTAQQLDIPVVCGPNVGGWSPVRPNEFWEESLSDLFVNRLRYARNIISLRLMDPDILLGFSEYHRDMLRSMVDDTRIEVLLPAVNDGFRPTPETTRDTDVLYVGDLSRQKGYPTFLETLGRLDGDLSLSVDVVGGRPESHPTFETIDVTVHGVVPRKELPDYYRRATLFVCLSADEMGPNTLVEAFSCGTPALVNDERGMREYVRNGNGVLCNRADVDDIASKIRDCLRDADDLTRNAEAMADSYDICRTIEQLGEIYRSTTWSDHCNL